MKKTTKRILSIILIGIMAIGMLSCKKKDDTTDKSVEKEISAPTPTPVPVVTMEDLFEIQKENTDKFTKLMKAVSTEEKLDIPDSSVFGDIFLKFSLNLMENVTGNIDIKGDMDFKSFANTAHLNLNMDVDGNMNGESSTEKKQLEMYIDNTGDDDTIRIYESEEAGVWKLIERSISEMIEQYSNGQAAAGQNAEGENHGESKYFKDFDKFLKKHTTMEEVSGVFRNTTAFTLPEFRVYYRNDINAAINDLTDTVTKALNGLFAGDDGSNMNSVAGMIVNLFNEIVNGMTGEIRIIQDFNSELAPTVLTFEINKLDITTTSNLKLNLNVEQLSLKLTNREEHEPVEIPEDVKTNAEPVNSSIDSFGPGVMF
ncbi:MAG: hypothetical protein K6E62_06060 [Lachnospiraceae bacterium]|nr:hypothetical protein [Lachnospiraceae bacterium]